MSNDNNEEKDCCVRVAVRIRPKNSREKIDLCRICTTVTSNEPQIVLGVDKAFTYDYVFDINSTQEEIYTNCIEGLVDGALKGYNATVLAYGQTGSGKTFTMGTGFERDLHDKQIGIIPRAVDQLFAGIREAQNQYIDDQSETSLNEKTHFSVAVQFIELYNEDIIDLLDPYSKDRTLKIVENGNHEIFITGATIKAIESPLDALMCLKQGALARTTASTKMNDQSSRSHALFTILIKRQKLLSHNDLETVTSKFNFVDLAGSERLKRTGATGERAKEGISINFGLLALGNCISALGDLTKKATHIPYRDSKLTRLLQDSLGGNSQTLMIACISPCDRDFMETLNTLQYANRARNIKNRVQINQDQSSRTICQLKREIAALQEEILEFKQGKRNADSVGNSSLSDTYYENTLLLASNKELQDRIKSMQGTINNLTEQNIKLKVEKEAHRLANMDDIDDSIESLIAGYLTEIEQLQAKLIESEEMYQQLKKSYNQTTSQQYVRKFQKPSAMYSDLDDIIVLAKKEIEREREAILSGSILEGSNPLNNDNVYNDFNEDSEMDSDDKTLEMEADLNDINSDIEIKSKLIEQLELSQQRLEVMRQHYEEKMNILTAKILNTEKERDEVLSNLATKKGTGGSNDNLKKVREDYEKKITSIQRELRKLQQAQKEHGQKQRVIQAQEARLRALRSELDQLKCIKTRLMRKIAEQTSRHKEAETKRIREIAQLRKEQLRSLNAVKTLQAKMQAKEQILKRKTEEVTALRKSQRNNLSRKAAGRVENKDAPNTPSENSTRNRLENILQSISWAARNKQLLIQFEKELEKLLNEREGLSRELEIIQNRSESTKNIDLANEEDAIRSNLKYVEESIRLIYQSIVECEEGRENNANSESHNFKTILSGMESLEEAKYLLERLVENFISISCSSSLNENRIQEQETLLKEAHQETEIQKQLLLYLLNQKKPMEISEILDSFSISKESMMQSENQNDSDSLHSNSTYDISPDETSSSICFPDISIENTSKVLSSNLNAAVDLSLVNNSKKVRRRTAHAQELLFGDKNKNNLPQTDIQKGMMKIINQLSSVPNAPGSPL